MTNTALVLLPIPTERPYSYLVEDGVSLEIGQIVQVPLGPREVIGVVWDGQQDNIAPEKLKKITKIFDCPPIGLSLLKFVDWVAHYTISPPGMVLRMVLRSPGAYDPPKPEEGLQYSDIDPERLTGAREKVLELVRDGFVWSKSGLAHAAGVSSSVVGGLVKLGSLKTIIMPAKPLYPKPDPDYCKPELSKQQDAAAKELVERVEDEKFSISLLDGITGSGKTEVYFEAMSSAFRQNRQALVLLPEIALTKGFLDRFEKRFGTRPAEWHSDITPKKREKIWRQIATGDIQVVVGARSAIYLPFKSLGLIVVDEEHEAAFKQEDRVYYNARDMAVVRGSLANVAVVLSSATPSIESRVNADQGRYHYLRLDQRYRDASLPELRLVDMRKDPPARGKFLSPVLIAEINKAMDREEQALVFLNRRGYAPLTLCRACGHRFNCDQCSAWLVEHRFRRQLVCHHCAHQESVPEACPKCGTLDHLVACGPGVERLSEELLEHFCDKRIIVLSSDMAGGTARLRLELDAIANGDVDIIVGTQLVAKGHNFPLLSCVGVVDADLGLSNGDPRASERTFQLLSQVTGRAGRSGLASVGLVQTYQPENPVLQAIISGKRDEFYAKEIEMRKSVGLPPYSRLASIVVSSHERQKALDHANGLRLACVLDEAIQVLGPAEAPISQIRGRYRYRLLFRAEKSSELNQYLRSALQSGPKPRGDIRASIDIDPQSFM